jgi:hypothetical protein
MFLHVDAVQHLDAYKLRLTFSNGKRKTVDLSQELYGPVFEPLKDEAFFKQVTINAETQTIQWPNGADFAPEFLDALGEEVENTTDRLSQPAT